MIDVSVELVPDPDDPRLALPMVDCEVAGSTVRAVLDSGARRTRLVDHPAIRPMGKEPRDDGTSAFGSTRHEDGGWVSVRFGGQALGTLEVAIAPSALQGHGNLVGQDVLSHFRCEYRLWEGLLRLNGDLPADVEPVHLDTGKHLYLDATWGGNRHASAVFDTGASATVVDRQFADDHSALFVPAGESEGMDASGVVFPTPMAMMKGPQILRHRFAESLVAVVDLTVANNGLERRMDMILGWPLIRQATWIFDHTKRVGACRPASQASSLRP